MPSVLACAAVLVLTSVPVWSEQASEAQRLYEAGNYNEALQAIAADRERGEDPPERAFLAAQIHLRLEEREQARAEFARLEATEDEAWSHTGRSGSLLLEGNAGGAVQASREAVEANGDLMFAHYQLGLAASRANDFATAATALTRAVELQPDFAYAHYYAGLALQRQKQLPRAAERLKMFLDLAPEAPERAAVQAILRTLR